MVGGEAQPVLMDARLKFQGRPSRYRFVLPTFALALLLSLPDLVGAPQTNRVVRVGAFNYYPGIFKAADGHVHGFYVDLFRSIAELENWKVEYVYGTWAEGLERLRSGEVDVLTSVARTPEREAYMDYASEPLLTVWGELYVAQDSKHARVEDLKGRIIGVMSGDFNALYLSNNITQFIGPNACEFRAYADFEAVFRAVESGAVYAGVVNSTYGTARQKQFQVKPTGYIFNPFNIYFAVAKGKNPDVLSILNGYLVKWQAEPSSPYHQSRLRWLRGTGETVQVFPSWLKYVLIGFGFVCLGAAVFIYLVRLQVARATEQVRGSEEKFRTLVKNLPGAAYRSEVNAPWKALLMSEGVLALTGYAAAEFESGRVNWGSLVEPEDQVMVATDVERGVMANTTYEIEYRIRHADGSVRWVHEKGMCTRDKAGKPAWLDGVIIDVTGRKHAELQRLDMERRLLHAQKLESLGVLSGGIAHDFNNLLTAVLGNLDLAMMDLPKQNPAVSCLDDAKQAVRKAADLTRQLLAYSGRGRFQIGELNLSEVVSEMANLLRVSIAKTSELKLELASKLPKVMADGAQVQQIILNLLTNASEATGKHPGRIHLSTGSGSFDADYLAQSRLEEKPAPGTYVFLEVKDNGCGMTPEVQQRLFDPFFTTKFTGRGLGMSAVLGVVQGHKGAIMVNSQPGKGTTIRVLFPALPTETTNEPLEAPVKAGENVQFSGLALVVDDEEPVRKLAGKALVRMGFEVITAGDGFEAVKLFTPRHQEFSFVLLDLTMPRMDGLATLAEMQKINPKIKAVLASGFDASELTERFAGRGFAGFIQKPYQIKTLEEVVQQTIQAG
jgi:PAS domain S-box-containing protein